MEDIYGAELLILQNRNYGGENQGNQKSFYTIIPVDREKQTKKFCFSFWLL